MTTLDAAGLPGLFRAIATGDRATVARCLADEPALATAGLARRDEYFIPECHAQVYQGDTALHAAAFAYDVETARDLVAIGRRRPRPQPPRR